MSRIWRIAERRLRPSSLNSRFILRVLLRKRKRRSGFRGGSCRFFGSFRHASYRDGKGWSIPYKTTKGEKRRSFANFRDCQNNNSFNDVIFNSAMRHAGTTTTFEDRLSAKECELCGKTNVPLEFHHVNKVKNLKGKRPWEIIMIAKKRKTLAVCKDCHHKIHHP